MPKSEREKMDEVVSSNSALKRAREGAGAEPCGSQGQICPNHSFSNSHAVSPLPEALAFPQKLTSPSIVSSYCIKHSPNR